MLLDFSLGFVFTGTCSYDGGSEKKVNRKCSTKFREKFDETEALIGRDILLGQSGALLQNEHLLRMRTRFVIVKNGCGSSR